MKVFRQIEITSEKDLCFGKANHPLKYGWNLEIGNGQVVPEIKYFPRPKFLQSENDSIEIYRKITREILQHAVDLGVTSVSLETEFPEKLMIQKTWAAKSTEAQLGVMEEFHEEYGINLGLRSTIADIRNFTEGGLRDGKFHIVLDNFEMQADAGAHLMSIESFGGKEVFGHALIRGDLEGVLFGGGILGAIDVRFLWKEIIERLNKKSIAAGDTACAHANSSMVLANGLIGRRISHVFSAIVRAISGVRSLGAYEAGARGPGKDCGYENIYMKAITGYPMAFEGKTSACAHTSLVGNIAMVATDLWSNESVEHIQLFSGMAPNAFLEMLNYDCEMLNSALKLGKERDLVEILVDSNQFKDPQALVLTPASAIRISKAIVSEKTDYNRSVAAAKEAVTIIQENLESLKLPRLETKYLQRIEKTLDSLPTEEDAFIEGQINKFKEKCNEFVPKNYGF